MILIAWFVISIVLLCIGAALWQPYWMVARFQQRCYCARCHKDLCDQQKFALEYEATQSLEGRQV